MNISVSMCFTRSFPCRVYEDILDATALEVFSHLAGTWRPRTNELASSIFGFRWWLGGELLPVYHCLIGVGDGCYDLKLLDMFYDHGLRSMMHWMGGDRHHLSGFARTFNLLLLPFFPAMFASFFNSLAIYQEERVQISSTGEDIKKRVWNVLFFPAMMYRRMMGCHYPDPGNLQNLIQQSALLCDPLNADDCNCYCSVSGCLPVHKLERCHPKRYGDSRDEDVYDYHDKCKSITLKCQVQMLQTWVDLCDLEYDEIEHCYKEFCRLEIFDRLGMIHTCCTSATVEGTLEEAQDQEDELKEQLQIFMVIFQTYCDKHQGQLEEVLTDWFEKLDEILPALRPVERCPKRCLQWWDYDNYMNAADYHQMEQKLYDERIELEKEVLDKKGYLGMDFLDVIKVHCADFLNNGTTQDQDYYSPKWLSPDRVITSSLVRRRPIWVTSVFKQST